MERAVQKGSRQDVTAQTEQTHAGPVVTPAVDIFENNHAILVLADMPGVGAETLNIDLTDNVLTLTGLAAPAQGPGETEVLREYYPGTFYRQFTLSESIDREKIEAKLENGVLRLELPKTQEAKPRKITVKAG